MARIGFTPMTTTSRLKNFYCDASGNVRQTPAQTFSGAIDCIALRDSRIYFNKAGEFDRLHALYMAKDAATVQGYTYSYIETDSPGEEYVMYEIPANQDRVIIIPNRDYADFVYMDTEYSFGKISDETRGELRFATLNEYGSGSDADFIIFEKNTLTPIVTLSKDSFVYNGKIQKPTVTVKAGDAVLKESKDYTVEYPSGMIEVGTYIIKINLKGEFEGELSANFKIIKAPTSDTKDDPTTLETENNLAKAPTVEAQEKAILSQKTDSDPKGSNYGLLQAQVKIVKKNAVTLKWKKVKGATSYVVYGNKCGNNNRFKKLKTVSGTLYTQKKLKKGTYYKYLVVAVKGSKAISTSKTIHVATTGGKVGNPKSIQLYKKSVIIKVKRTAKITAKQVAASSKLKVKKHRAIAFESSNTNIATVTKKGVIKGVRKGTCYVYVYAQNGVMAKVKVSVKK